MFWDVEKGNRVGSREPPNGHLFRLDQAVGLPCDWIYADLPFGWEVHFWLHADRMGVTLRDSVLRDNVYFIDGEDYPPLPEYRAFTNEKQTPVNNWGCFGHCIIFWMVDIIALAEFFGFTTVTDTLFEFFTVTTTEFVVKFCSLELRANIKLKISP